MPAAALSTVDVGSLYTQHIGWLRNWLCRRTRCPQRAEDLAQDTYFRLVERPWSVSPETPRTYLATIARRLLIDDVRRRDIERAILDACAPKDGGIDTVSPERIVEAAQLLHGVIQLLEALPEQTRQAFLMRRVDGLSQGEVADRLGISPSTVKRHIAAAYAQCLVLAYAD